MRLTRIDVAGLPGLTEPFSLEPATGINVVIGPNASGKSSLVRAVRSLLWPDSVADAQRLRLTVEMLVADGPCSARRGLAGDVAWEREGRPLAAPSLPGGDLQGRYELGLFDLTAPGDDDERFAAEIRRQMSGGFDLDLDAGSLYYRHGGTSTRKQRALSDAESELDTVGRALRHLAAREQGLADLNSRLEASTEAVRRITVLKAALAAISTRTNLTEREAALAALPPGLAAFRAEDSDELRSLVRRAHQEQVEIAAAGTRRKAALADLAQLPQAADGAMSPAAVDPLLDAWSIAERDRDAARVACAGAAAQVTLLADRLAGCELPAGTPSRSDVKQLARLFVDAESARARRAAAELLLLELPGNGERGEDGDDAVRAALAELERWLAAPVPSRLLPGAVAVVSLAVALAALTPPAHPLAAAAALVLALGGGIRFVLAVIAVRGSNASARAAAQALRTAGFGTTPADRTAATTFRDDQRRRLAVRDAATSWKSRLDATRRQAAQDEDAAGDEAAQLLARAGMGRHTDGTTVLHDAPLAVALHEARAAAAGRDAELAHCDDRLEAAAKAARAALAAAGAQSPTPATAAAGAALLRDWRDRLAARADAQQRADREQEAIAQSERRRDEALAQLQALRSRLGLAADGTQDDHLAALAGRHAEWQQAVRRRDEAAACLAAAVATADGELVALPANELDGRLARARIEAAREPELRQEIADLSADLRQAREGSRYAEALARRDRLRDELAEDRETARRAALATAILADLREQSAATRPQVLAAAAAHLERFTRGAHRLELVHGGGERPAFAAFDTRSNERVSLADLSDGTRAQLLLAVRLAFIESLEDGEPLPLFLDEALGTTDDERFDAIAGALGELAARGRQLFYLTSQPRDAVAWRAALDARGLPAPTTLDLMAARGRGAAATPAQLPPPPVPFSDRVPALRPWLDAKAQHVAWLLPADRTQQDRLVAAHARLVGAALAASGDLESAGVLTEAAAAELHRRALMLQLFCEGRRVGRGRAVTPEDIDASGAVTPTMRGRVLECLAEAEGDPRAFDRCLDRVGLQQKKKAQLRDYLLEQGIMPDREPLDEAAIVHRMLAELGRRATAAAAASPDVNEVRDCVARWWRAAEVSAPAPGPAD
ncbi:MAG: hypothetical protein IPK64_15720 [bacterium]|nr:hypothetical protein [bacterium]